jgi:hypothetical protein
MHLYGFHGGNFRFDLTTQGRRCRARDTTKSHLNMCLLCEIFCRLHRIGRQPESDCLINRVLQANDLKMTNWTERACAYSDIEFDRKFSGRRGGVGSVFLAQ